MKNRLWIAALALVGCQGEVHHDSPWIKPESVTLGCEDYQSISVDSGTLYNNVWNKHADTSGKGLQCLESKTVEGEIWYGWSWSWPEGKRVIYGYPQIKRGISPWAPQTGSGEGFPAKIADLKHLRLEFETETVTNGKHNLAASMWLTSEPMSGDTSNPSIITTEVMVWTYSTKGHFNPAGKKLAEVTIGGQDWEVWVDKSWKDVSGKNENRWSYVTFRALKHSLAGDIDLLKLLGYAVDQQWIRDDMYVSDLELGNEIMSGSGITWVKSFKVSLD
jgi:hypothetical protein